MLVPCVNRSKRDLENENARRDCLGKMEMLR